jgi:RimJ/RimL family protein N-acetyltransferase
VLDTGAIVTARLRLTPLDEPDADVMVDVLNDGRMHTFTGGAPLSREQLRARYSRLAVGRSANGKELWFNWIVRVEGAQPVGVMQATVTVDRGQADVAWEVGVPWQGRGYASEAAAAVVAWLVSNGVGDVRALVHPDHTASARVAARAGLAITTELVDGERVWRRRPGG